MENIFTHWESVINFTRNDIVFERHNKEYGAYIIRKYYPERLRNAFLYVLAGFSLLFGLAYLLPSKPKPPVIKPSGEYVVSITPITPDKPLTVNPVTPQQKVEPVETTVRYKVVENIDDAKIPDEPQTPPDEGTERNTTENTSGPPDGPPTGQTAGTGTDINPPNPGPILFAQEMPIFDGGDPMLDKFLHDNIHYPPIARENGIEGKVYVTFVVGNDGKIKDAKIVRGIGGGCEEEALRVIRLMPDWKPGRNNGHPVEVQLTMPINFVLVK